MGWNSPRRTLALSRTTVSGFVTTRGQAPTTCTVSIVMSRSQVLYHSCTTKWLGVIVVALALFKSFALPLSLREISNAPTVLNSPRRRLDSHCLIVLIPPRGGRRLCQAAPFLRFVPQRTLAEHCRRFLSSTE